jgi:aspartyl-tRNA(Asn)/glutamyl-tRNA(Gln) amidotransferase subunit B
MKYETVIGLEIHAELATQSKMFCSCPVVDSTQVEPNVAVCPVCAGMPGVLPVVNQQAVEMAIMVGLALECKIEPTSLFARKNYFYPDLPKGYQISQYEYPIASNGRLVIDTSAGEKVVRIRRAHLEEDAGKLTHVRTDKENYSLVDLNRAGLPLLEIVTEPDMHSVEEARAYATALRALVRALGVNSGDMEKGVIRFEANISVRPEGSTELGTRTEVKNLNSFRAMERAIVYEVDRQIALIERGEKVQQATLGWNEAEGKTYSQRSKEEAHDYRYFPEPDLPPLVVEEEWVERVRASLPELPRSRQLRMKKQYGLSGVDTALLVSEGAVADYFEKAVAAAGADVPAKVVSNYVLGELFGWINQTGQAIGDLKVGPQGLAELLKALQRGAINQSTAKVVLIEMLENGTSAMSIIQERGLEQVSDSDLISKLVSETINASPNEVKSYLAGKETLANWFFGQIMRQAGGKANPAVVRAELERQLQHLKAV